MRARLPPLLLAAACSGEPGDDAGESGAPECAPLDGAYAPGPHGGDTRVSLDSTSFFRTTTLCGRHWLVTPEGHPLWSAGVNVVSPTGSTGRETGVDEYGEAVAAKYADEAAWPRPP